MGQPTVLLLLVAASVALCQYVYQQPIYYQRPVQQPQLVYYPMRTNCANRCVPQTRYRLTYRPVVPPQPVRQIIQRPGQPIIPINPVPPPPPQVIRPPQPLPQTLPPSTLPPTIVPTLLPTVTSTLPTPGPESTAPSTPSTTTPSTTTASSTTPSTTTTTTTPSTTTPAPTTTVTDPVPTLYRRTESPTTPRTPPTPGPEQKETARSTTKEPSTSRLIIDIASTPESPEPNQARPEKTIRPLPTGEGNPNFWRIGSPNPCDSGNPLKNDFGAPITCNALQDNNGGCPETHFCHAGVGPATTQCCPRKEEVPRCEQPRSPGIGRETAARWYYDVAAKQCKRFLFKGLKANENNFITKTACMEACTTPEPKSAPEPKNPCRLGQFARNESTRAKVECGFTNGLECPNGYYCHIGLDKENSACCETSGLTDACLLSLNMGAGKEQIKRFYYNTLTKKCTEFIYKGTKGNENNFLTEIECEAKCKQYSDPCPVSGGKLEVRPSCTLDGSECESDEWCHVGHSPMTTVCCPGAVDACSLSLEVGDGGHNLTRWYADPEDKRCNRECKPFQYGGSKGNQNNFLTKALCEEKCKRKCIDPCGSGSLLYLPSGDPRTCSPLNPCPNTHWCHVGVTQQTTVCCSAVPDTCSLSLAIGHGSSHLTRWRFDGDKKKCVSFFYSGEGGNQNMFLTAEDCAAVCPTFVNPCAGGKPIMIGTEPKVCSSSERCPSTHFCHVGAEAGENYCCPKSGDPCDMPKLVGVGEHSLNRWFFDADTTKCEQFAYRGAKGNANNFLTKKECQKACPVLPNPCRDGDPLLGDDKSPVICGGEDGCKSGYFCHVGASPDTTFCCPGTRRACDLPMEIGTGDAKLERFFFDGTVQTCRAFTYKGLKGNANNFLTVSACREACREANPCGTSEPFVDSEGERMMCTGGQKHDSCPAGFFCHVGGSALTTICCPKGEVEPCDQPREEGTGDESLPRFFYNKRTGRCSAFVYGGMGGNGNNFISASTCKSACPVHRGFCPHGMPLANGKESLVTCGADEPCPSGYICHVNVDKKSSVCCHDPTDFCLAARDPGPCAKTEIRYGYDASVDSCIPYEWGGCGGSLNNFVSLQRCTQICCKEYAKKK